MGRSWSSPTGKGIWLGYLLRPEVPQSASLISLRVGLIMCQALERVGIHASLKWPNDIICNDKKLAGVLCEARWRGVEVEWMAVGVGMNVHGPVPNELADRAIAVDDLVTSVSRIQVLDILIPLLAGLPHTGELTAAEVGAFAKRDWLAGRRLVAPESGVAAGIDERGALLVDVGGQIRRVTGGTIVTA